MSDDGGPRYRNLFHQVATLESERDTLAERVEKLERALGDLLDAIAVSPHDVDNPTLEAEERARKLLSRPSTPPTDGAV